MKITTSNTFGFAVRAYGSIDGGLAYVHVLCANSANYNYDGSSNKSKIVDSDGSWGIKVYHKHWEGIVLHLGYGSGGMLAEITGCNRNKNTGVIVDTTLTSLPDGYTQIYPTT